MSIVNQAQSPEDTIVESFLRDQVIFVDVHVTPPPPGGGNPGHSFHPDKYVNGDGDVVCLTCGKCQIKFKLVWHPKYFKRVMFTEGMPDAADGDGALDRERPALVIGLPDSTGCPAAFANPPFHDVVRETTGQMVSVINDNPGGPDKNQYAYRLNVLATEHDGTQRLIRIDPRIINK